MAGCEGIKIVGQPTRSARWEPPRVLGSNQDLDDTVFRALNSGLGLPLPTMMKHDSPSWLNPLARFALAPLMIGLALVLTGCAQHYTITTTNGATLSSKGRPKLSGGYYYFQDNEGREQRINELRVREIAAQ